MNKFLVFCCLWLTVSSGAEAQKKKRSAKKADRPEVQAKAARDAYRFSVDLTQAKNDQLKVTLLTPAVKGEETVYYLPKIVPGTYANYDFGRFVSEFRALDGNGQPLPVEKLDANSWKIKNAGALRQLAYSVEDTYDTDQDNVIFEPAGTSIEEKVFALNTHGFFGYFDGMKNVKYEINVTKPAGFYGSTSLVATESTPTRDTYATDSYASLTDAPMLYCQPDTTVLKIGGADILVSVYSPNRVAGSRAIADNIQELLTAQKQYLGDTLPIRKYAFLIYLFDQPSKSGSMGALEHSYSSFYCLPEAKPELLTQTIRDVSSHEFFHILTPLSIHSEEIGDFDYNQPKMSKHLWLYEGVTEYSAGHMQIKHGLIDLKTYLGMVNEKMTTAAASFNDTLPFTEMSEGCLERYKDQYGNVYQKGALIGLCLDVKLRSLSKGKYGIQNLMTDLSKRYGKDQSFKDDELFDQITQLTYPEIREFFARYVEGSEPLPLKETFGLVGLGYSGGGTKKVASLGKIALGYNDKTGRIAVTNVEQMNAFGKKLGYRKGDEFVSLNGKELSAETFSQLTSDYQANTKEGDPVEVVVIRKGEDGKENNVKLSAPALLVDSEAGYEVTPLPNPAPEQTALRDAWLKP
ncbi:MAG: peptidase M61 [Ferruginibacter sp.]|nr:peptidase M61 [Cytophagales bacterium]